jgi:hypothetical protein
MATNRYDTPAQANFVNTYVPIPFDQLMKVGLMKQQLVEQNDQASSDLLATLGTTKVAKPDEKGYLAWRGEQQKTLNDILNNAQPGSYEAKRAIMNLRTKIATDPYYRMVTQNYEPYTKAYSEYQDKGGEYGFDSSAVYARGKQLRAFEEQGGTKGLMDKNGVGLFQPTGIGPNAELKPEVEQYINNTVADSWGSENVDASGKYIVGSSGSALGYDKLGAPLGIQFEQYVQGGKKMLRLATDKNGEVDLSKVNVPSDIFRTKAGQTLKDEASMISEQSGGKISFEEALKRKYLDTAYRSIQERVSQKSDYTLKADPYGSAAWNKMLEDQKPVYTMDVLVGEAGSKETSSLFNIQSAKDTLATKVLGIDKTKEEYLQKYKVAYDTNKDAVDDQGRFVGSVLSEFEANKQQEIDKQNSLDKMVDDVRRDTGISPNWRLSEDIKKAAADYASGKAEKDKFSEMAGNANTGKAVDGTLYSEGSTIYNKYYNDYVNSKSKEAKIINEALAKNSAAKMVNVGVTTFPTTSDQKTMEDIVYKFSNEGEGAKNRLGGGTMTITDAKTGLPYTDKDYEKISRTGKTEEKPEVLGMFYSTKKGWPQLMVRFKDSTGKMMDPSYIDAPQGTEDIFIRAGKISNAEIMIQRELADLNSTSSKTGNITSDLTGRLGNKSSDARLGEYVDVRVLQPSRQSSTPEGDQYEATFFDFRTGKNEVVNFKSRDALVSAYIKYKIEQNNFQANKATTK